MSIPSPTARWQLAFALLLLAACSPFQPEVAFQSYVNGQDFLPPPTPSNTYVDEVGEAMLRGPIHEAFAEQVNPNPVAGIVIAQQPPEPIEELPPAVRPEGPRVEWISGYWAWDEDREDFIWVSGVWRKLPPDVAWLPGYWAEIAEGYQWIAGTWVAEQREQIDYIAQSPPESLELGPVGDAPSDEYFWISGHWVWQGSSYAWAPGYWTRVQPDWVWIPTRYLYTPRGYVHCNGYWDYPLASRGTLFAPYWFSQRPSFGPGNYFRPQVVVALNLLPWHLWVRPGYQHYYFGDYYAANYRTLGIQPWHTHYRQSHGYDPLFTYYEQTRQTNNLSFYQVINQQFNLSMNQTDRRPPRSYRDQLQLGLSPDLVASGNRGGRDIGPRGIDDSARLVLGSSIDEWASNKDVRFANLSEGDRERYRNLAVEQHDVAASRRIAEVAASRDRDLDPDLRRPSDRIDQRDGNQQRDENRVGRTEPSERGNSWRLPFNRSRDSSDRDRTDRAVARDPNNRDRNNEADYRAARPAVDDQTPSPATSGETRSARERTNDLNDLRPDVSDVMRSPDTRLAPSSNLQRDLALPGENARPNSAAPPSPDRSEPERTMPDRAMPDRTTPNVTGPSGARPGSARPAGVGLGGERPDGVGLGGERPGSERPGNLGPGNLGPGSGRPDNERPGNVGPGGERPGNVGPGGERPGNVGLGGERPGSVGLGGERPGSVGPGSGRPDGVGLGGERPGSERPGSQRPGNERSGSVVPGSGLPGNVGPGNVGPGSGRPDGAGLGGLRSGGANPSRPIINPRPPQESKVAPKPAEASSRPSAPQQGTGGGDASNRSNKGKGSDKDKDNREERKQGGKKD